MRALFLDDLSADDSFLIDHCVGCVLDWGSLDPSLRELSYDVFAFLLLLDCERGVAVVDNFDLEFSCLLHFGVLLGNCIGVLYKSDYYEDGIKIADKGGVISVFRCLITHTRNRVYIEGFMQFKSYKILYRNLNSI